MCVCVCVDARYLAMNRNNLNVDDKIKCSAYLQKDGKHAQKALTSITELQK
jgi:hypothetical protein